MQQLQNPPTFLPQNTLLFSPWNLLSFPMSSSPPPYFSTLGLGYAIAIALAFLVLLSSILLASYICCRHRPPIPTSSDGIILPRIIFVAEDDRDEDSLVMGLDQAVINSYPRFPYCRDTSAATCSICLSEFKDSEILRMMPECSHSFHIACIDAWLRLNASCPVCRNSPLPTPLSTPLSEVVPLSQYAADRRRR